MDSRMPAEQTFTWPRSESSVGLQVGGVYRRTYPQHGNSKKPPPFELWRLLCVDREHDELIFKKVSVRWDKVEKNAFIVALCDALDLKDQHLLTPVPDGVRPQFMSWDDEKLIADSPKALALGRNRKLGVEARLLALREWLSARDRDFAVIKSLVTLEPGNGDAGGSTSEVDVVRDEEAREALLVRAYSPRYAAESVAACAKAAARTQQVVKRLLHRYAWFGMGKNALLRLDAGKGLTGPLSRNNAHKSGPKDAAQIVGGESYAVRPRQDADLPKFLFALTHYWADRHLSLRKSYRMMVETLYVTRNQYGEHQNRAIHIPTERMFRYAAKTLIAKHKLDERRRGHKDAMDIAKRRGYDTDIAPHVGTVFDIDGTPFNRELVGRWKVKTKRVNIGKAYVVLVFDRASKKCVGWHVYVGNENWKEGYRLAVFCAITPKAERLKWLRIDAPKAWPEGQDIRPATVYVDGGPGASKKGQAAMSKINVDFFHSPPDSPYLKSTVEGGLGLFQAEQAQSSGGYARTTDSIEKEAKRLAKLHAKATLWEFERALVLDIIDYNARIQKRARLTDRMKQDGVLPTANDIFRYGVEKMGGAAHRRMLAAEAYEKLLEHKSVELTVDGVRLLNSRYQSRRMDQHFAHRGRCKISVFYDPLRPAVIFWRTPDGILDRVERDRQSAKENGLASSYDMEAHGLHLRAAAQMSERSGGRRKNKLTRAQENILLGDDRKLVRKAPTKNESELRAWEAAADLNERTYDRAENFLPVPPEGAAHDYAVPGNLRTVSANDAPEAARDTVAANSSSKPNVAERTPSAGPASAHTTNVVPLKKSRTSALFEELLQQAEHDDDES